MSDNTSSLNLPIEVRRSAILEPLKQREFVRVSDLTRQYHVSEVTIRADLAWAAQEPGVVRIHGGAMFAPIDGKEPRYEDAVAAHSEQKRRIAVAAAARVNSGDTVILDVGSTTAAVAAALANRQDLTDVTVITNSLSNAQTLEPLIPRFTVILTGGTLRPLQHSLVEPFASHIFSSIAANIAIIGATGVEATAGITNINLPESELKRAMVRAATSVVVVADSTKIGRVDKGRIARVDEVSTLITAGDVDSDRLDALKSAGLDVVVA